MALQIDPKLLKPITPSIHHDWMMWEKKNFNIHRGVIEFQASDVTSIETLAQQVRDGVRDEFRPSWWRGFGFGTVIHVTRVPADITEISCHVDGRNKRHGVWQWMIICFDQEHVAVGIHTWMHGYLRPVYDSILHQLNADGFTCESTDAEMDALIATLRRIAKAGRIIEGFGGFLS